MAFAAIRGGHKRTPLLYASAHECGVLQELIDIPSTAAF